MADGITTASIETDHHLGTDQNGRTNGRQVNFQNKSFRSFFEVIPFEFSLEIDTALADAAGAGAAMEVIVTMTGATGVEGARLGDFVWLACETDVADLSLVGYVTASNVVTVQLQNLTGGDLTTFNPAGGLVVRGLILRINPNIMATLHNSD